MELKRKNGALMLVITPDIHISFRESWVLDLKELPYTEFGKYIRKNIYPVFTSSDRSIWNKTTINNKDLQTAIEEYLKTEGTSGVEEEPESVF